MNDPIHPQVERTIELEWCSKECFDFEDLVWWHGKAEGIKFKDVVNKIDTIVSGPHASATYPEELKPFVSASLTRRKQFDYSDVSTKALGRRWAEIDEHVVFVENPYARWIFDPNRTRPTATSLRRSPTRDLKALYRRRRFVRCASPYCCVSNSTCMSVAFRGVDGVRPLTFVGDDILAEPQDEQQWIDLEEALLLAASKGPGRYQQCLEEVVAAVLEVAKGRLTFISMHDTCNQQVRSEDGAIVSERKGVGRYPKIVNFGNVGNGYGDGNCCFADSCCGRPRSCCDMFMLMKGRRRPLSTPGHRMRIIAAAWARSFGCTVDDVDEWARQLGDMPQSEAHTQDYSFNRPSLGVEETFGWSAHFRERWPQADVFQVEFEREVLLGSEAAAACREPGEDWPPIDRVRHVDAVAQTVGDVAEKLKTANDQLREIFKE